MISSVSPVAGSFPEPVTALPDCEICGEPALRILCDARQLAAHAQRLERFHAERLRSASEEELEERARFTQHDPADLLVCGSCGVVLRWPRPPEAALRRIYARDEYAPERLAEMIASQRALFRRKIPVLSALLGKPERVLEIGSFVGGFLEEARGRRAGTRSASTRAGRWSGSAGAAVCG